MDIKKLAPPSTFRLDVPTREPLLGKMAAISLALVTLAVLIIVPVMALLLPDTSPFYMSAYALTLIGKILCFAIVAMALDLVWGYCGILSLGHGFFFSIGGYIMGMYLMRQIGAEGVYQSVLPDFMVFLDWKELPWFWVGSDHFIWVIAMLLLIPGLFAWIFGYFAFRSRIKGVYFSIITQALTYAAMLLFFRNETGFGGNNGFTDFKKILGYSISAPETRVTLFLMSFLILVGSFILCRWIVSSKLGRVIKAIRDAESRVMFCAYDPLGFKLFIWTFSAFLCALAGALFVPQVGIINPGEMSPTNSIEMVIWVAMGGRGTLLGPVIGAFAVNGAKSYFTANFAEYWLFFLGLMFVLVTIFLPKGILGLYELLRQKKVTSS